MPQTCAILLHILIVNESTTSPKLLVFLSYPWLYIAMGHRVNAPKTLSKIRQLHAGPLGACVIPSNIAQVQPHSVLPISFPLLPPFVAIRVVCVVTRSIAMGLLTAQRKGC